MLSLRRRELCWQLHFDAGVGVPLLLGLSDRGHAVPLQTEHLAVLRERRNLETHGPSFERRNLDFAAQHRGGDRQRDLDVDVATFPFELGMRREAYAQIKVAGRRAAGAVLAFPRHAYARTVAHAGWNPDIHGTRMAVVFQREPPGGAAVRVFERELDFVLDVAAFTLSRPAAAAGAPPRFALGTLDAAAEKCRKEVGE